MPQPCDVDAFLGGSQIPAPAAHAPHETKPPGDVRDSQTANVSSSHELAAALLGEAWPAPGTRHLATMALAGALVRHTDDETAIAFVERVREIAGATDKPWKARSLVLEARAKSLADDPFTGWPALADLVGAEVVRDVRYLLDMAPPPDITGMENFGDDGDFPQPPPPEDPLNVITYGEKKNSSHDNNVYLLSQTPEWAGVFRFDVLSRKHVAVRPPFDMRMKQGNLSLGDIGKVRLWFARQNLKVSADAAVAAIATVCESSRNWNPFAEYLDSLPPSTGALGMVHMTLLRTEDPFHSVLFTKTLVAAVRRARAAPGPGEDQPPVDHQGVLVLSGDQGVGKGRLVKILAGKWYSSVDISRLKDKDTVLKCQGSVLVELEEMSTSGAQDRDALKRFFSASDDFERRPFDKEAEKVARTYAMIATTNDARLEDPTGHRRMWPIILTPGVLIDHEAATALRDALWSEANALAATDYDHHLTPAEAARCAGDAKLLERDDGNAADVADACSGKDFVTVREVYNHMTKGTKRDDMVPSRDSTGITDSLKRLGCTATRAYVEGVRTRGWAVPDSVRGATLSPDGRAYRASLEVAESLRTITRN